MSRIGRLVRRASAVAAAAGLGLVAFAAGPANAAVNYDSIVNYNSEKCMTIKGGSQSNGAPAIQQSCIHDPFRPGKQLFGRVVLDEPARIFAFKNLYSGKCLEVKDNSIWPGAPIVQSTCDYDNNQRWDRYENPDGSRTYRVISSGLCLSVLGGSFQNGAAVIQEECNGEPWQKWWEED